LNLGDLLKYFTIDKWYKVFIVVGAIFFGISLAFEVKGITNFQAQLLSGGIFFIGIGEWKNHKVYKSIMPANAYTGGPGIITSIKREPDSLGIIFDIIGIALIVTFFYQIINSGNININPHLNIPIANPGGEYI
jgi:hypothetical protein